MRCRLTRVLAGLELKIALAATRSHTHVMVEPTSSSLAILPYAPTAAAENTSVISILMYGYCEHFVLFGGLCEKNLAIA